MKHFLSLSFVVMLFSSCCVYSSRDCHCDPPDPFLAESTKDWIVPFSSGEYLFETSGLPVSEQTVYREYKEGSECVGGDECCSAFPIHTTDFSIVNLGVKQPLLNTKAIENYVRFFVEYHRYTGIATLNVDNGSFTTPDYISLIEADTLINGVSTPKIIFYKTDPTKNEILFDQLEFVKGVGVVRYTDTAGRVWTKK